MSEQSPLPLTGGDPTPWKVLTVHPPWAWAIIYGTPAAGYKDMENRGWPTDWRHRVFIHAGKVLDIPKDQVTPELAKALRQAGLSWEDVPVPGWAWPDGALANPLAYPFGAVIGHVRYAACTKKWNPSRWAERDCWHHWLRDPVRIDPIPAAGRLNLWTPSDKDQPGLHARLAAIP